MSQQEKRQRGGIKVRYTLDSSVITQGKSVDPRPTNLVSPDARLDSKFDQHRITRSTPPMDPPMDPGQQLKNSSKCFTPNELYRSGESGMGYSLFTVIFKTDNSSLQSSQAYVTGGAVDFIDYPEGKGPKDVVRVLPHVGRESNYREGPKYYWCLYSE